MPQATVTTDLRKALNVHRHLAPEIALDLIVAVDDLAEAVGLLLGEVLDTRLEVEARIVHDLLRSRGPDAEDVCQRDFDALVVGDVNAGNTCHESALLLLVFWIGANDESNTAPLNLFALFAARFDGRHDLHVRVLLSSFRSLSER